MRRKKTQMRKGVLNKKGGRIVMLLSGLLFGILPCRYGYAAQGGRLMQMLTGEDIVSCYVSGIDTYDSVSGQIGQEVVEARVEEQNFPKHTVILIDNSLSITEKNQKKIEEILKGVIAQKEESETVSLAVYGEEIHYLIKDETNTEELLDAVYSIQYENQDSYLTDILYEELEEQKGETEYTRFLIATDGVDNKAIGYTKEELTAYLKTNPFPIYTLGCRYKENDAELENLFAISRLTNSGYFLLDDYEETDSIVAQLNENVMRIELDVPENLRDGSVRSVLLSFQSGQKEEKLIGEVSMPFGIRPETAWEPQTTETEMPIETKEESQEDVLEETQQETVADAFGETQESQTKGGPDLITILAGVVIVSALLFLLMSNIKKKKTKGEKEEQQNQKKDENVPHRQNVEQKKIEQDRDYEDDRTILVPVQEDERTIFTGKRAAYILTLKDRNEPGRTFRYPLLHRIVIGRKKGEDVNLVLSFDPSISARHCEITVEDDVVYIRDLNSANGTYVNGERVRGKERLETDDEVRFGRSCMIVEISRQNKSEGRE